MIFAAATMAVAIVPIQYAQVAPGIEHAAFRSVAGFTGHAFRIEISKVDMKVVSAGSDGVRNAVSRMVSTIPAVLATNASFFDVDGKAMGMVVSQGEKLKPRPRGSWGALVIRKGRAELRSGSEISQREKPDLVVQGMPFLVRRGNISQLKPQRSERTAVCAEGSSLILVTSTPSFAGDFAAFLSAPPGLGLGCTNALNLDGGHSTQMVARFKNFSVEIPGGSGVPNALVIVPRG